MPWRHESEVGHRTKGSASNIRDVILGGQDGLVNVLGVILAVATATQNTKLVIIAGLAATFAESISMGAVGYTSSKAAKEFYESELEREKREMREIPDLERKEIRDIYYKKGFKGTMLNAIVRKITSNDKLWLRTMMEEELRMFPDEWEKPWRNAAVIGFSAIVGSLVPLIPFLVFNVRTGILAALVVSALVLFFSGFAKAKITIGNPVKSGIEMAAIGMIAAIAGFAIGTILGVAIYAA